MLPRPQEQQFWFKHCLQNSWKCHSHGHPTPEVTGGTPDTSQILQNSWKCYSHGQLGLSHH
jgi:hypothetical protein